MKNAASTQPSRLSVPTASISQTDSEMPEICSIA